jgi:hypothetical protein
MTKKFKKKFHDWNFSQRVPPYQNILTTQNFFLCFFGHLILLKNVWFFDWWWQKSSKKNFTTEIFLNVYHPIKIFWRKKKIFSLEYFFFSSHNTLNSCSLPLTEKKKFFAPQFFNFTLPPYGPSKTDRAPQKFFLYFFCHLILLKNVWFFDWWWQKSSKKNFLITAPIEPISRH